MMAMYLLVMLGVIGVCVNGQTEGDIQLVGNETRGRVEIYYNNAWGTVCDDAFSDVEAIVVCRQLNIQFDSVTFYPDGGGCGQIWLEELGCFGTESELQNCSHSGWGIHNCGHHEDVGVECFVLNGTEETTTEADTSIQINSCTEAATTTQTTTEAVTTTQTTTEAATTTQTTTEAATTTQTTTEAATTTQTTTEAATTTQTTTEAATATEPTKESASSSINRLSAFWKVAIAATVLLLI